MPSKLLESVRKIAAGISFLALAGLILLGIPANTLSFHPLLWTSLWSGSHRGYALPGSQTEILRTLLPPTGTISYLSDQSFKGGEESEKMLYDAQNYLCPLLLNTEPFEHFAIIDCSSNEIAQKRMNETAYIPLTLLSEGKGLAVKKT